jgi:hypothetical protein
MYEESPMKLWKGSEEVIGETVEFDAVQENPGNHGNRPKS